MSPFKKQETDGNSPVMKAGAIVDEKSREMTKRNEIPVANIYLKLSHRDHMNQLNGLALMDNNELPNKF